MVQINIGKSIIDQKNVALLEHNHEYDGEFPAGLRILIVDDDREYLSQLEDMLKKCHYVVTKCDKAIEALCLLRTDRNKFDIVICNLHMPEIDGFKLLEIASLEMDLPVIIMSRDEGKDTILKGINYGACDYWVKPVNPGNIKLIWQHVVRKRKQMQQQQPLGSIANCLASTKKSDQYGESSSKDKLVKKRKDDKENEDDNSDGTNNAKRPRMVWSSELHQKFVEAVTQLGNERAVPKKILECMQAMGCETVTRENIASHLQKYRLYKLKSNFPPENEHYARDFKNMQQPKKSIFEQGSSSNMWNIQSYHALSSNQLIPSNGWTPQQMERTLIHSQNLGFPVTADPNSYYNVSFIDPTNLMPSTIAEFSANESLIMPDIPPQVANAPFDYSFCNDEPVPNSSFSTAPHELMEDEGTSVSTGLAKQFNEDHFFLQDQKVNIN